MWQGVVWGLDTYNHFHRSSRAPVISSFTPSYREEKAEERRQEAEERRHEAEERRHEAEELALCFYAGENEVRSEVRSELRRGV
jgi:hypothetical protein